MWGMLIEPVACTIEIGCEWTEVVSPRAQVLVLDLENWNESVFRFSLFILYKSPVI